MVKIYTKYIDMLDNEEINTWKIIQKQEEYQHPFYSLSFAQAVAASGRKVLVSILRLENEIIGFFPHHKKSSWIFSLIGEGERLGSSMSDYFGILLKSGEIVSLTDVLCASGLTRFTFSHLPETFLTPELAECESRIAPQIILNQDGYQYWRKLAVQNRKFTKDTERSERAIVKSLGPLIFRYSHNDRDELKLLIDRKRLQYKRTGVKDALSEKWHRELLQILLEIHNEDCSGVLSTLYAGDTWIASHFGVFARGVLHYWFPVYNPDLKKYSPGRLLLKQIIMLSAELNISVIDCGEGDSPSKRYFANYEHRLYRGEWHDGSVRALICKIIERCVWKIEGLVR